MVAYCWEGSCCDNWGWGWILALTKGVKVVVVVWLEFGGELMGSLRFWLLTYWPCMIEFAAEVEEEDAKDAGGWSIGPWSAKLRSEK